MALLKQRNNLVAGLEPLRAPGVEGATGRDIDRARHFPLQRGPVYPCAGSRLCLWGGCKEDFRIRMHRLVKELVRFCLFHDLSEVHDADYIAEIMYDPQVVAYEKK